MSKRKPISQTEARALRRRVKELEDRDEARMRRYGTTYPGGTHLGNVSWDTDIHLASAVYTAQILGHVIVCKADGKHTIQLYAVRP